MTPAELRESRLLAQLTQAQAAQKAGVDLRTWQRWEYGEIPMPRTERLWFLAIEPDLSIPALLRKQAS